MLPLTRLASETSLTGAPQKQDSKIRLGGQAADPPGVRSAQRTCRSKAGGPERCFWTPYVYRSQNHKVRLQGAFWGGGVVVSSSRLFSTSAAL